MDRLRQPGDSDYDVLGLSPGATDEEIDRAFYRLIDGEGYRIGVPFNRQWLRAHQIKAAHASLSDPAKRRDYDKSLSRTDQALWVTRADEPATDELVLPKAKPRPARPIAKSRAPDALVPSDAVRTSSGPESAPDKAPKPDGEQAARLVRKGLPSPDPTPPLNDNGANSSPASIDKRPVSVRSWDVATILALGLGLVLITSWLEWDRRPSTIGGTSGFTPGGQQTSQAARHNEVTAQEAVKLIPEEMANAQPPAANRRAGIATPAAQTSSAPAKTAEARTVAPYPKPPPTRSPAIKNARVAAESPKSLVGSAPQWIGGGPTDADNRRGQYQGTVALQVNVEPSGRVSNCAPVRGSGDAGLDALTCRLVRERARFTPAHNSQGRPVVGQAYISFAWVDR